MFLCMEEAVQWEIYYRVEYYVAPIRVYWFSSV